MEARHQNDSDAFSIDLLDESPKGVRDCATPLDMNGLKPMPTHSSQAIQNPAQPTDLSLTNQLRTEVSDRQGHEIFLAEEYS